jgi:hypothetical protein
MPHGEDALARGRIIVGRIIVAVVVAVLGIIKSQTPLLDYEGSCFSPSQVHTYAKAQAGWSNWRRTDKPVIDAADISVRCKRNEHSTLTRLRLSFRPKVTLLHSYLRASLHVRESLMLAIVFLTRSSSRSRPYLG